MHTTPRFVPDTCPIARYWPFNYIIIKRLCITAPVDLIKQSDLSGFTELSDILIKLNTVVLLSGTPRDLKNPFELPVVRDNKT